MFVGQDIVVVSIEESPNDFPVEVIFLVDCLVCLVEAEQFVQVESGFGFLLSFVKVLQPIKVGLADSFRDTIKEYFQQKFWDVGSFVLFCDFLFFHNIREVSFKMPFQN